MCIHEREREIPICGVLFAVLCTDLTCKLAVHLSGIERLSLGGDQNVQEVEAMNVAILTGNLETVSSFSSLHVVGFCD